MIRRNVDLVPGGEYSIEVDPRTVDRSRLAHLAALGFNLLSFGVQDFDPTVQRAVHRVQPAEQVVALVEGAREIGFESVNLDLIYGLPMQTPESFARTLQQVMAVMCQGEIDFQAFETSYLIDFKSYFAAELESLEELSEHGLVVIEPAGIRVTESGWFLVRAIGMVFDKYLQADRDRARFSQII